MYAFISVSLFTKYCQIFNFISSSQNHHVMHRDEVFIPILPVRKKRLRDADFLPSSS